GLTSGALFAIVGLLYERTHTRDVGAYGGVARRLPHFAWAFLLVTMASIGLPGTSGFAAEFLALLGLAQYSLPLGVLAVGGVILGALYMLTMFRRVMHGPEGPHAEALVPLTMREGFVLACFSAGILAVGVRPDLWLRMFQPDVDALLAAAGIR
ncbi:MAG: proton-conducting transporter membrane subunit, partial [bacterium]